MAAATMFWTFHAMAARPVARWDVIPDQVFDGTFEIGVCALHLDGVSVEFSVGGKPLATAAMRSRRHRRLRASEGTPQLRRPRGIGAC